MTHACAGSDVQCKITWYPWAISVLISNSSSTNASNGTLGTGTKTGFLNSTVTNWSTGAAGGHQISPLPELS
jgi:hypothetical protein